MRVELGVVGCAGLSSHDSRRARECLSKTNEKVSFGVLMGEVASRVSKLLVEAAVAKREADHIAGSKTVCDVEESFVW